MTQIVAGCFAFALLLAASPAMAQEPASVAAADGRTYTPADFARFAPRTALDMLRQVPGFVIRQAEQERGLGQATGNVLLNGERISGKSNDALTELGRIPAGNVVRIEIVDGARLNIPGLSGQVANVVAEVDGISGQWAWRPEFRSYYTDPLLARGDASVSGDLGAVEYTLAFAIQGGHSGAGGPTDIFNPDGSLREHREDVWTSEYKAPTLSARLVFDAAGDSVGNLNASYQRVDYDYAEVGERTGPALVPRVREVGVTEGGYNYEVGGDYAFALGAGRLKLIGLERFGDSPVGQEVITRPADATPPTGSRFARESEKHERIVRTEYDFEGAGAKWQVSAEAAFNSLENIAEFAVLQPDGSLLPVPLPGASATVEEDRYQLMGSYTRPLWTGATLQLAAGGEYSTIEQLGEGGQVRSFERPKGLLSLAWTVNPALDLNLSLERRVGQLNFQDFLAQVNLTDDRENAGNPDLVPPQSWELEGEAVRKLGAWGTTGLRLYYHRIDDIVDIVPIGETGESPGNLDQATLYGLEWKSTVQFDPLGWRGAKLDARLMLQDSRVDDPLTGEARPISNSPLRAAELNLRHDVPDTDWAWGSNLGYWYNSRNYRLTEVGRQWEGPTWGSFFVEHKNVKGLTVRATAGNQFDARSLWDRDVYIGRRTGPLDFHEVRNRRIGPIFSLSISGKF